MTAKTPTRAEVREDVRRVVREVVPEVVKEVLAEEQVALVPSEMVLPNPERPTDEAGIAAYNIALNNTKSETYRVLLALGNAVGDAEDFQGIEQAWSDAAPKFTELADGIQKTLQELAKPH